MVFVGIIEKDQSTVQEITSFFLEMEEYSLLFVCASLEEYKGLSVAKKTRTGLIIINPGEKNFDRLWQSSYLRQTSPGAHILMLCEVEIGDYLRAKLKEAGASCIIHKQNIIQELKECCEKTLGKVNTSNGYIKHNRAHELNLHLNEKRGRLTNREYELVGWVMKGHTNKKIGEMMYISTYTVNAHLRKIYIKYAVRSRTELISRIINELV